MCEEPPPSGGGSSVELLGRRGRPGSRTSGSGAARQLLPQRRELLVAGQRATALGRCGSALRGVVGGGGNVARLRVDLSGLADLGDVLLVALVGLGVLLLPRLALRLEAF